MTCYKEHHRSNTCRKFLNEFRILFIKTFRLTYRKPIQTLIEIFLAYTFMGMLLGIRYILNRELYDEFRLPRFRPQDALIVNGTGNVIYYYPGNICSTMIITDAVNDLTNRWPAFPNNIQILSDPTLASVSNATLQSIFAFIYFTNLDFCTNRSTMPDDVQYTLRMQENGPYYYRAQQVKINPNDYLWKRSPEEFCQNNRTLVNYTHSFLAIQYHIDISIIKYATNTSVNLLSSIFMNHFGCPRMYIDQLQTVYSFFIPVFFSIIYLVTFIMNVGYIVTERENKTKEYLRIYGLRTWINNLVWIVRSMLIYFLLTIGVTLLSLIQLPKSDTKFSVKKAVFNSTNWFLLWTVLFVYSIQVSSFSVFFGQFFKRPLLAKLIGFLIWIITFIDFYPGVPVAIRYLLCLFPNTGLMFCLQVILQYERKANNLTMNEIYSNLFSYRLYIGICLLTMLIYSVIYFCLAIYIERINPGEFGIAQPWFYPFRISRLPTATVRPSEIRQSNNQWVELSSIDNSRKAAVSIQNLTKEFGRFQAVSNLSLDFYRGEVCSLLGENGAGKTTTTFILVGMLEPTYGQVLIEGFDIQKDLQNARASLGFCPQYDILYDDLTVDEHLELIGNLRHIESKQLEQSIESILQLIGLTNDRKTLAKNLSGGMKRRLSIGISLIGDPKVLILDEPTSGIDPYNRRLIWTIIRQMKQADKCLLLTTHFLEEADMLSDRIAIMTNGHLQAKGKPDFLKQQINFEYRLFVDITDRLIHQRTIDFIREYLPQIILERQSSTQLIFNIKREDSPHISEFLYAFEDFSQTIGIKNYGLTMTTIEDVFLALIHQTESEHNSQLQNQLTGKSQSVFQQFIGLLLKRWHVLRRQYIFVFGFICLPILIEILLVSTVPTPQTILSTLIQNGRIKDAQVPLIPSIYNPHTIVIYANNNDNVIRTRLVESIQRTRADIDEISTDNVLNYVRERYLQTEEIFINKYQIGFAVYNTGTSSLPSLIIDSFFSTVNYHAMATSLALSATNLFQFYANSSRKMIRTINQPILTPSKVYSSAEQFFELLYCFDTIPLSLFNFLNAILASIFMSILLVPIVHERVTHSKDLQLLTNLSKKIYWFSNVCFDLSLCLLLSTLLTIIVQLGALFNPEPQSEVHIYLHSTQISYFFLLFFLYTLASLPLIYVYSFLPKSELIGFVNFFIFNIVACFLDMVFAFIAVFSQQQSSTTTTMNNLRLVISILFPSANLKRSLYNIRLNSDVDCISVLNSILLTNYSFQKNWNSIQEPGLGSQILIFLGQMIFWTIVLIFIENRKRIQRWCQTKNQDNQPWDDSHLDVDVQTERQLVLHENIQKTSSVLLVRDLVRQFKKQTNSFVVDHLNFRVTKRSCFGLLGSNGAGKTTTFRMLINDLFPTSGEIFLNRTNITELQSDLDIGFCPQSDWLIDNLTVIETLHLFARLKGLKTLDSCSNVIEIFNLENYAKQKVGRLSGGNKRKLSTAIAFLANPQIIFLDEPTTGLDAVAKRKLWHVIRSARDIGLTIVMTSHSMEECEALCTRIGIMKSGQFVCLGNLQRLKTRFSLGYNARIKVSPTNLTRFKSELDSILPGIEIDEQANGMLYCTIPLAFKLAYLFDLFHRKKSERIIETFSLTQTTLEQIFVHLTEDNEETLV